MENLRINKAIKDRFVFPLDHSNHSKKRANQRGINIKYIQLALLYCKSFFKQGLIFHVVQDKLIPKYINPNTIGKIRNLVIVIAGDSGTIITCYKSKHAMHNIKKKSEVLF